MAFVQNHAADQLHIVMALAEGAFRGLAYGGKGFRKDGVQIGFFSKALPQFACTGAQCLVRERLPPRFEAVDSVDLLGVGFDYTLICRAENSARQSPHHGMTSKIIQISEAATSPPLRDKRAAGQCQRCCRWRGLVQQTGCASFGDMV